MTQTYRRTSRADRRARIVDALALVVRERGYASTTVTEVCARANVGRGAFYEAFDGLQDAFLAVIDEAGRGTCALIERAFGRDDHGHSDAGAALGDAGRPPVASFGSLMETIAALHLGARAATVEIERWDTLAGKTLAEHNAGAEAAPIMEVEIPNRLRDPRAHRARSCVRYLAEHPGASNRQIARAIGIGRDDQMSTMLARLAGMELLVKLQGSPGGPNAWSLSPRGTQVAHALAGYERIEQASGGETARFNPSGRFSTCVRFSDRDSAETCVKP